MKCCGLAAAKDWTKNFSCKSCSELTAATETAIAAPATHKALTVTDTALIDPAKSHPHERSVAAPSDNFWDNFQPHHAVTERQIYHLVVTWKPSFFTLGKNKTGEQFVEALHSVLSPIAVNTDRSDTSLTLCMILPHLTLSRTKNTDDGSNNKTIKRRLRAWNSCNFSKLFCEAKAIQMRMNSRNKKQNSDLKMLNDFMSRGKISNAIRVLSDEHTSGVLAPTDLIDGRPVLECRPVDDVRYDSAKLLLHLVQNPVHGSCSTREEAQLLLNPLRQTCIGILGRGESKLTKSVQTFCVFNFCIFQEICTGLRASDN